MNILHLSPYFPSTETNHAGGVCMGKQIETLRQRHKVYVLTFVASEFDEKLSGLYKGSKYYKYVRINKFSRFVHILTEPYMPNYFAARSSIRFAILMIYMIRKYEIDAIHAEYASMGQYIWIKKIFPHIQFNMTEHDMTVQSYERKLEECHGIKRAYVLRQLRQIRKREKRYCELADHLFTFNKKDKQLLELYFGRKDCLVLNPYYGIEDSLLEKRISIEKKEYGNICFLGQMGREENYLAAMDLIRIAEKVKHYISELQVYIVGSQPPEELKQQENEFIHVTGFVDNVDEYLERAQLAVFPLSLGAGIKLKVLRSLAAGTPVVTTVVGAEGIDESGRVLYIAKTDEEFVEKIIKYIKDKNLQLKKIVDSREYVKRYFGWDESERILEKVYGGNK